jgi:hypothetical protein
MEYEHDRERAEDGWVISDLDVLCPACAFVREEDDRNAREAAYQRRCEERHEGPHRKRRRGAR